MPLIDTAVRQAKPTGKNYTFKDTAGLALFVGAKGAKQWHFRFYRLGKQALPSPSFGTALIQLAGRPVTVMLVCQQRLAHMHPSVEARDWIRCGELKHQTMSERAVSHCLCTYQFC